MAMTAPTLLQEHLPHNMVISEEDAEFEEDDDIAYARDHNVDAFAANKQLQNGLEGQGDDMGENGVADAGALSDLTDEDAEGEEDEEVGALDQSVGMNEDTEEEEDDEIEGVGAVKIQPKGMEDDDGSIASIQDDDDDDDSASDAAAELSGKDSDADSEVEAEWAQGEDEEDIVETGRNSCV